MLSFGGQASLRENTLAYAAIQTISRSIGYCMLQRSQATPLLQVYTDRETNGVVYVYSTQLGLQQLLLLRNSAYNLF